MPLTGICLALAASAAAPVFVPTSQFTVAWTHSIEKVRWEEDYAVLPGPPVALRALSARVRGSAAGMEPPDDAQLRGGWYHYRPTTPLPEALRLTRSEFTPDFTLCVHGSCRPMGHWLPSDGGITLLSACTQPHADGAPG
ncbi:MAG TPA: DUF1850 domain-containing protein [Comamonadaceae bacterium]|uniref:DUF1850 domain-containing protein n=1 Tax=Pulveribacter sp. TaxID=2678893 RepID=UPI000EBB516D|nr:DUF1850 domain-containing protein [Pulveribacter sp.]HCL84969.1 DUF1850 domain-containing protein [Comamonadaceae bacterium]